MVILVSMNPAPPFDSVTDLIDLSRGPRGSQFRVFWSSDQVPRQALSTRNQDDNAGTQYHAFDFRERQGK